MLVVTRKKSEAVIVTMPDGRLIRVLVVDVRENKTRIGIDAPADVAIDREEIWERRQEGSRSREYRKS